MRKQIVLLVATISLAASAATFRVAAPDGSAVCTVTPPDYGAGAVLETTNLTGGVAWRVRFTGTGERTIEREEWTFDFGEDFRCWPVSHAQGEYIPKTLSTIATMKPMPGAAAIAAGKGHTHNYWRTYPGTAESPLVVEGNGWVAALGDAGVIDYARIRFASGGKLGELKTVLEGPATVALPYVTPWRYVHCAKDCVALANEQPRFMDALNAPSRIADTSWIKPGKVLRVAKLNEACGKDCVDFAVRNDITYIELDAGWYGPERSGDPMKPNAYVEPIIDYATRKGVGVILYVNRDPLKKNRDAILDLLASWGVKGIKYGFLHVGDQSWRKWATEAIEAAAKRKLMVDIHDEYRLTGIQKTYPNVMTVEGICGNEEMPNAAHDCALPFTRFLDGPGDYTPCWNQARVKNTLAHQLALPCVYTSGWQFLFWYSRPEQINEKDPALDFWREIPCAFDETRFLQGKIGEYAVVARRVGEKWFVGGLNGLARRNFSIPLDFVGEGDLDVRIFMDADPALTEGLGKVAVSARRMKSGDVLSVDAAARGGFALIVEKAKTEGCRIPASNASESPVPSPAEWVDSRLGTARAFGSNVLGPCVPYGSAHPSPDTLWPTPHSGARGSHHGFGAPTSGWWPGDKVVGFSQLHAQGTGGTPSYGIFRYVCDPQDMEILEAHPYLLKVRLKPSGLLVDVSATSHGAVYRVRDANGAPRTLPLDRRCKLAKADCVNAAGEFTGNWNPAPYRCFAHSEVDDATGIHRIAVSFKSDEQAQAYFAAELAGRTPDDVARDSKRLWDEALSCISIEGVDDTERAHFYSILAQTFIQPRDRTADGIGWDDHYTLWDTWRTHFPLKAIIDPQAFAGNVNSFADRFARTGRCDACYTSGKEYKVGQGGDEADCVIAEAWAKKIPGIDWARVVPLLRSRWTGRTKGYRERGYVPSGEREDYCGRMKSGSATMNFAYQDWCCAQVLRGLGDVEMAEKFLARSGNWTNVWDATAFDAPSGVRGFARARGKNGRFSKTDPRRGFNTDFYEANCWEYSFFVPHDMDGLIRRCGGRDAFERRVAYALENNLVAFDNEPSFLIPWLFAYTGRGDLATKWAPRVATLFKGLDLPGDNDSGAMCALYVFIQFGFFPVAGQDLYLMHGSTYPKIVIRPRGGGKTFTIRSVNYAKGRRVKSVTLNGKPHDPLFLRHAEIAAGGELVFTYE